jgi:hypothetical protein
MDVSPIQRLAIIASQVTKPVPTVREAPAVPPPAQATPASADQEATHRSPGSEASTQVVVAWHAASLGYVTRVVDQHSGSVVYESPPEQVLEMVQQVIERLEGSSE